MPQYPAALDSPEDLLVAQNNWTTRTILAVGILDTEILLERVDGLQTANGLLSIDDEIVAYTSIDTSGTYPMLLGCKRGYDGTEAKGHDKGAPVEDRWVAEHNNRLVAAVKDIVAALGDTPNYEPSTNVAYTSMVARLSRALPLLVSMPLLSTWTAVHNRRRVVAVSLFKATAKGLTPFQAPVIQTVDLLGSSSVTATLDSPMTGYMLLQ